MAKGNENIQALMKARRNLDKMSLLADLLRSKFAGKYSKIATALEKISHESVKIANSVEFQLDIIESCVIQK